MICMYFGHLTIRYYSTKLNIKETIFIYRYVEIVTPRVLIVSTTKVVVAIFRENPIYLRKLTLFKNH